ncbi:MAG: Rrf2 family transcriptional regulator [Rhodothermaceae bacterium]
MSASTKLSTAVKALCFLAEKFPEPQNSTEISKKIGVNASKIRQIMSMLCKHEITGSTKGTQGGFILRRDFTSLTLLEIYDALEDRKIMEFDVSEAAGENIEDNKKYNSYFNHFFWNIQKQIEERMKDITLESIKDDAEKINNIG